MGLPDDLFPREARDLFLAPDVATTIAITVAVTIPKGPGRQFFPGCA